MLKTYSLSTFASIFIFNFSNYFVIVYFLHTHVFYCKRAVRWPNFHYFWFIFVYFYFLYRPNLSPLNWLPSFLGIAWQSPRLLPWSQGGENSTNPSLWPSQSQLLLAREWLTNIPVTPPPSAYSVQSQVTTAPSSQGCEVLVLAPNIFKIHEIIKTCWGKTWSARISLS